MAIDLARAKALFLDASDLASPEERAAYLDRECGGEAELRARVEALLAADDRAAGFLEPDAIAVSHPEFAATQEPSRASVLRSATHLEPGSGERSTDGVAGTIAGAPPDRSLGGLIPGRVIAGRYTLLELLGEGGMGAVYRAEQSQPVKRPVALKLIKTGMDSRAVLARFDAERQALALMDHPNIARVYDGGATAANQPFFVMELVSGVPITEYCDQHRLPVPARLELFVTVCQAVQHAHQKGIIHRDLKPGNILVTEVDGRPTPKVIDFGVAKATEVNLTDQTLGDAGAIVGTPAYMSPEQADPSSMDIDTRTDVYALGVILYELLAGSPPIDAKQFQRGALLEMLRMVRDVDPPRPSTKVSTADALPSIAAVRGVDPEHLKQSLRGDLDWIVMKALAKDRTRRYETANGFGADLQRHLANEPVVAAPPSRVYRIRKFVRKHRSAVIAASLVLLALLAGISGKTWGLIEARRQELEAQRQALEARRQERIARAEAVEKERARQAEAMRAEGERLAKQKALAAADAEKTAREMAQMSFAEARKAEAEARKAEAEARKAEKEATKQRNRADHEAEVTRQNLYYAQMHLAQQAWREHRGVPHMLELLANWLPKGTSTDRRGWEWFYLNSLPHQNLSTLAEPRGADHPVSVVVWHVASKRLAAGASDGSIRIWDVDREQATSTLRGPAPAQTWDNARWIAWSPDGRKLAGGGNDGTVHLWDTVSGRELQVLEGHKSPVRSVAFSSDGTRVAAWGQDGTITIRDTSTGRVTAAVAHPDGVLAGGWSPDDTRLASGHVDGTVTVSGTHPGDKIVTLRGHAGSVMDLAWSPDGARVASGGEEGTVRIWEVASEQTVVGPLRHSHQIRSVAWAPDGQKLATGSVDQTVKLWDATTGQAAVTLRGHVNHVTSLSWGPDDRLASGCADGSVKVWNTIRDQESRVLSGHVVRATSVAWSPDGQRLASGDDRRMVCVWDARTVRNLAIMRGHNDFVDGVAWSPDGQRLASAGLDNSVRVWDPRTGEEAFVLRGNAGSFYGVSWHPDGARLAAACSDGQIWIWDATRGFERDTTPRALPYIDRKVASGTARGADHLRYAESYLRAGRRRDALLAVKDDPFGMCTLARELARRGDSLLAPEARTRACALVEEQLAAEPHNAALASEFADLLLCEDRAAWSVLKPTKMRSDRGATLTLQADGSILASGINASGEIYTMTATADLDRIAAVRLEALPDPSFPHKGPGRHPTGNFQLRAFRLHQATSDGGGGQAPLPVASAWASFDAKASDADIAGTVDGRLKKAWSVSGRVGEAQEAIFVLKEPVTTRAGRPIVIKLHHRDSNPGINLGRFRLSASGDPAVLAREQKRFVAAKLTDPWARLAAAYHVTGDPQAALRVIDQHRTAASGIGDLYAATHEWEPAIAAYRNALTDQPADRDVLTRLADAYQAAGRTREAVPHLAALSSARPNDTWLLMTVAGLQAWFGQDKELADTCQRGLALAKDTKDVLLADRVAKICSMRGSDDPQREAALVLARRAVERGKGHKYLAYFQLGLGMAEYRSGHFVEADAALTAAMKGAGQYPHIAATSAIYRAMSLLRQGKPDEARALATLAAAKMKPLPADELNPLAGDGMHDDLIQWLPYIEAKALIRFDAAAAAPAPRER